MSIHWWWFQLKPRTVVGLSLGYGKSSEGWGVKRSRGRGGGVWVEDRDPLLIRW